MPRLVRGRGQSNTVKNEVIVNADSAEEARRKGWKYFSYTSRDTYQISGTKEIQPGKWKVTALRRNPSATETRSKFKPQRHTETDEEVREPYI